MDPELIPRHVEDLTPEWVTGTLRSGGHLGNARVTQARREALGDGKGFMGVVARLHLDFEGDPGDVPSTLIAKLPTPIPENRMMAELMGAYWREIHFYQELGGRVPVRTPALFHADLTPDPMRQRQDKIVRVMDKLPGRFVDWMMTFSESVTTRQDHRYMLLIEDLSPARVGDQVAGGSAETCDETLRAAARMHAAFWQHAALDQHFWLADQLVTPRIRHRMFLASRESFETRYGNLLRDGLTPYVDWMARFGVELAHALNRQAPSTLIHGDLRLDNIFFDDEEHGDGVIFADWQLTGRGPAGYDVAYFLSGSLDAGASDQTVRELLHAYFEALCEQGVEGYSFDALLRDYRRGLLSMVQTLSTTDTMQLGDDRGVELIDVWLERCLARLRDVDPSALL